MMRIPYQSFLSTIPFTIQGPSGKQFFVHSALIARKSKVLDRDVNGRMKEADDKIIEIADVDGDIDDGTVMRFIEYAYTGDYTVPEPGEIDNDDDDSLHKNVELSHKSQDLFASLLLGLEAFDFESDLGRPSWKKRSKKKNRGRVTNPNWTENSTLMDEPTIVQRKQDLWRNFVKVNGVTMETHAVWEPRRPDPVIGPDYTVDLVCHAKLYVFANRYDCHDLATLALQKLALTLSRYRPTNDLTPIVTLTTYIYHHTQEYTHGCDKLRSLIIDYLVCHLEAVMKEGSLKCLLQEPGAFADDLMTKTVQILG